MTALNVQAWVSMDDTEARRWLSLLVPEAGERLLRATEVLPVFLARYFGVAPDDADQAVGEALAQGLIENQDDDDDGGCYVSLTTT